MAELEASLSSGQALLWVGEHCAIVTTLHDGEVRELHGWLATGDMDEISQLVPGIAAHARALGCKFATIDGRKGWDRVFSKHGFTRDGDELRKLL